MIGMTWMMMLSYQVTINRCLSHAFLLASDRFQRGGGAGVLGAGVKTSTYVPGTVPGRNRTWCVLPGACCVSEKNRQQQNSNTSRNSNTNRIFEPWSSSLRFDLFLSCTLERSEQCRLLGRRPRLEDPAGAADPA